MSKGRDNGKNCGGGRTFGSLRPAAFAKYGPSIRVSSSIAPPPRGHWIPSSLGVRFEQQIDAGYRRSVRGGVPARSISTTQLPIVIGSSAVIHTEQLPSCALAYPFDPEKP